MIGNLNHIAIAVPDLDAAIKQYQTLFNVEILSPQDLPDHGVRVAVVLTDTRIELISPLGNDSPIQNFLKKHPQGGLHHLCYEVQDIQKAKEKLVADGIQPIGDGTPKPGYHNNPVLFFDPKDCQGVLIELEQTALPALEQQGRVGIDRIGPVHTFRQSSQASLKGIDGIGIGVEVDFKSPTPKDNKERD